MYKTIHIVLLSDQVGGMEKRFFGLWLYLQTHFQHPVYIATTTLLYEQISFDYEFRGIKKYAQQIHFLSMPKSKGQALHILNQYQKEHAGDIFHYIMKAPIFSITRNSIYSFPCNSLRLFPYWHKVYLVLLALRYKKMDILDPHIFEQCQRWFYYKRKQFSRTPNSYVNTQLIKIGNFSARNNTVLFASRFVKGKGLEKLIEALPEINNFLSAAKINEVQFVFLGYGPLQGLIEKCKEANKQMNIQIGFSDNLASEFKQAKIFLSLQDHTNYPSRSLMEAMASGVIPIVTNCGTTNLLAKQETAYFVPPHFSANDIANQIQTILQLPPKAYEERTSKARRWMETHCQLNSMANYYIHLYESFIM
jgi:glycosyltransferase involved in cell wall biosynthesis